MKNKSYIEQKFKEILSLKKNNLIWNFLSLDFSLITEEEELNYQIELLKYNWHQVHEEIVSGFQWKSNPITIESLYQTALNEEIEIMEYKPIARKCTWALADIGTNHAKKKLEELLMSGNEMIVEFAKKRIENWDKEKHRKGFKISVKNNLTTSCRTYIYLDLYKYRRKIIKSSPKQIITAQHSSDSIIVYQAFSNEIADYAITNQRFGGPHYSFNRMSWIKPNFLWMMYRSGWAEKNNQKRILAISISKVFFEKLLKKGQFTSLSQSNHENESIWRKFLNKSEVRIQWDPHHDPLGKKLDRKAIQIGIKGKLLKRFGIREINYIEDITKFVKNQKLYIEKGEIENLKTPIETELTIKDQEINNKLNILVKPYND